MHATVLCIHKNLCTIESCLKMIETTNFFFAALCLVASSCPWCCHIYSVLGCLLLSNVFPYYSLPCCTVLIFFCFHRSLICSPVINQSIQRLVFIHLNFETGKISLNRFSGFKYKFYQHGFRTIYVFISM